MEAFKQTINQMSDAELAEQFKFYKDKIVRMIALDADDIAKYTLLEAELKTRKEHGNS